MIRTLTPLHRGLTLVITLFLSTLVFAQAPGTWYFKEATSGDRAIGRQHATVAAYDGTLYLLGGYGNLPVQRYDPVTAEWATTKTKINNLHHFQAREVGGKLYIAGALDGHSRALRADNTVYAYDLATDKLKKVGEMPRDRIRGAVATAVYNQQLYLVGGVTGSELTASALVDRYDPRSGSWTPLPDAPRNRNNATAEVIADRLYVIGGTDERQLDVYDITSEKWLTAGELPDDLPVSFRDMASGVVDGKLVVAGGADGASGTVSERTFVLDPNTGGWTEYGALITGRQGAHAATIGGRMYVAGGLLDIGETRIAAEDVFVEFFSLRTETIGKYDGWAKLNRGRHVRAEAQMMGYQDEFYFFTGFELDNRLQNNNEKYDPATDTWSAISAIPDAADGSVRASTHNATVLVDGVIWVAGGRIANHPGRVTDEVWLYNITTDSWSEGPKLPARRGAGGFVRLGRELHYVGGFDENAQCDVADHYVYYLDRPEDGWEDRSMISPMPQARNHFGTAVLDGRMYAVGGQNGHDGCQGGHNQRVVHRYDPITDRWRQLADLPTSQSHNEPGVFAYNGKIYSVGGQNQRSQEVWEYDPASDRWTIRTDLRLPIRLIAPGARPYDNNLFVMGGGEVAVNHPRKDVRAHNFDRNVTRALSFYPNTLRMDRQAGETTRTILSNLSAEDEVAYRIDTDELPSWLTVEGVTPTVRQSFGEIRVRVDSSQLTKGTYTHRLVAEAEGYTSATLTITVEITTDRGPVDEGCADCVRDYTAEVECGATTGDWRTAYGYPEVGTNSAVFIGKSDYKAPTATSDNAITLATGKLAEGTYVLNLRMAAPNNSSNSVFIRVDNGKWIKFWKQLDGTNLLTTGFEWKEVNDSGKAITFELEEGEHTITFVNRESGTLLDRVYLGAVGADVARLAGPSQSCAAERAVAFGRSVTSKAVVGATDELSLEVYPNPAIDELNLRLTGPAVASISVYNAHGQLVATTGQSDAGERTRAIDVRILPSGVYRLVAVTAETQVTETVVIR